VYTPQEFAEKFGWANGPGRAQLAGAGFSEWEAGTVPMGEAKQPEQGEKRSGTAQTVRSAVTGCLGGAVLAASVGRAAGEFGHEGHDYAGAETVLQLLLLAGGCLGTLVGTAYGLYRGRREARP
jgi:hypothetical protein